MMIDNKYCSCKWSTVVLFTVFYSGTIYCQSSWNRSIDYKNEENYGISLLLPSDSLYVIGVISYDFDLPYGALLGVDQNGTKLWQSDIRFDSTAFFLTESFLIKDKIWSTGELNQPESNHLNPILIVHNFNGDEVWRKEYNFDPYLVEFRKGIYEYNDSTIIVFCNGYFIDENSNYFHKHGYILVNSFGEEILRHWFDSEFDVNLPHIIVPFPGGGYMLSILEIIESPGIPFEHTLEIKRLDDTFGIIWQKTLPCEEGGAGRFSFDSKQNIYVTWTEDSLIPGQCSPWGSPAVFSYNAEGEFRWKYVFDDNPRHRILGNIMTTSEENIVATGLDEPGFDPLQWGWLVSIDSSGNLLWDRKYTIKDIPGEFGGFFGDVRETSDQELIVIGNIHDKYPLESSEARDNVWLMKTDLNGCLAEVNCENYTLLTFDKSSDFEAAEIELYPNPTSETVTLSLPKPSQYIVEIYNSSGVNFKKQNGYGSDISVSMENLNPGYYVLCLTIDGKIISQGFIKN